MEVIVKVVWSVLSRPSPFWLDLCLFFFIRTWWILQDLKCSLTWLPYPELLLPFSFSVDLYAFPWMYFYCWTGLMRLDWLMQLISRINRYFLQNCEWNWSFELLAWHFWIFEEKCNPWILKHYMFSFFNHWARECWTHQCKNDVVIDVSIQLNLLIRPGTEDIFKRATWLFEADFNQIKHLRVSVESQREVYSSTLLTQPIWRNAKRSLLIESNNLHFFKKRSSLLDGRESLIDASSQNKRTKGVFGSEMEELMSFVHFIQLFGGM